MLKVDVTGKLNVPRRNCELVDKKSRLIKKSCRVLLICLARFRLISDYAAVVARIMDRLQSPSGTFHVQKSYLIIENKRQTALINIVSFRIFINLTFRMQFNIYFQK